MGECVVHGCNTFIPSPGGATESAATRFSRRNHHLPSRVTSTARGCPSVLPSCHSCPPDQARWDFLHVRAEDVLQRQAQVGGTVELAHPVGVEHRARLDPGSTARRRRRCAWRRCAAAGNRRWRRATAAPGRSRCSGCSAAVRARRAVTPRRSSSTRGERQGEMGAQRAALEAERLRLGLGVEFDAVVARVALVVGALDPARAFQSGAAFDEIAGAAQVEVGARPPPSRPASSVRRRARNRRCVPAGGRRCPAGRVRAGELTLVERTGASLISSSLGALSAAPSEERSAQLSSTSQRAASDGDTAPCVRESAVGLQRDRFAAQAAGQCQRAGRRPFVLQPQRLLPLVGAVDAAVRVGSGIDLLFLAFQRGVFQPRRCSRACPSRGRGAGRR